MSNNLSNPIFQSAEAARTYLESRLWPNGPICPFCGNENTATRLHGNSHRKGLLQCNSCRNPFTITVGTLYERSHVPLNKWLAATHLLVASKKGMSALQIGRLLGLSKKTAWFLCHRIRASFAEGKFDLFGREGKIVEADETYFGPASKQPGVRTDGSKFLKKNPKKAARRAIVSLVERGGSVRSFHVPRADAETVAKIVNTNISREARLFTDESRLYRRVGQNFAEHSSVMHSKEEYVRGDVHTNTMAIMPDLTQGYGLWSYIGYDASSPSNPSNEQLRLSSDAGNNIAEEIENFHDRSRHPDRTFGLSYYCRNGGSSFGR